MSSDQIKGDDTDSMQNVELHRAESMVEHTTESEIKEGKSPSPIAVPNNVFDYTTSKAITCFTFIRGMKIEVVMFMYMFSSILRMVSTTTMIMDKVCLTNLNFPKEVCSDLAHYPVQKNAVEKLANNISVGHSMITMLPACIISAFIGSWSDKYGRKVPLIISLVGIILDGLGVTLCAAFMDSRAEYVMITAIFTGLSGGIIAIMTLLYSYASDITTFGERTIKYAIMEMAFGLSMPIGQVTGGWLYKSAGYVPVFLLSTAGHLFSLFWVMFVLKETKGLDNVDAWAVKLKNLFSFTPVIDSVKATMKWRPNRGKQQILLLILAMSITVLSYASAGSISFLYAHHQYNWDNTQYSTVSAVFSVLGIVFMMIIVPVFKRLKLGDSVLGIAGNLSVFAKYLTMGFAIKPGLYFLAHLLGLLGSVGTLAGRSRISKVTSKDDLGKVFCFLSTAESLFPIMATAVVSQIFNATLDVFPGLIFFLVAGLLVIPIVIYTWLGRLPNVNYEEMHNTQEKMDVEAKTIHVETEPQKEKF